MARARDKNRRIQSAEYQKLKRNVGGTSRKPGRPRKNWQEIIRKGLEDIRLMKQRDWHTPEAQAIMSG